MAETNWNPATGILTETKEGNYLDLRKQRTPQQISREIKSEQAQGKIIRQTEQNIKQRRFSGIKKQFSPIKIKYVGGKGKIVSRRISPISTTSFGRTFGIGRGLKKGMTSKDQMKILRFKNQLEKERLKNQLERFKILHKLEIAKRKGTLGPAMNVLQQQMPLIKPQLYPAYSTPMEMADIDSAFSADIGHSDKSLWGGEQYYDETYYNEDYYGNEWDNDPFMHLNIKPQQGVSPLLW